MSEQYLWNRTGEPDPEIVRLEHLLAPVRYREPSTASRRRRPLLWLAVAAAVLVGIVSLTLLTRGSLTDWQRASGDKLRAGEWVETDGPVPTTIQSDKTGELQVDPGSRLRLLAASAGQDSFRLDQGTIHAFIWAPPGSFVVDTPSAKTVDLGCRYTLSVSKTGVGLLTVESGWVAFESHGTESFIPEGAACLTRPARGPGTPYFADAPNALVAALETFDTTAGTDGLHRVLASARPRDALTLWHLLKRTHGAQRGEVFDRFAGLMPLPQTVSRQAVLQGNAAAFDAAWNALDLGDTSWWRVWKRRW